MKTVLFIGPRLQKDGPIGYYGQEKTHEKQIAILKYIDEYVSKLNKDNCIISSMQGGIEQWAVEAAIKHDVPFIVNLPHDNAQAKLPDFAKAKFNIILEKAHLVENISSGDWSVEKMREKDRVLISKADVIISFYEKDTKELAEAPQTCEIIRPFKITQPPEDTNRTPDYYIPF